MDIGKKVIVQTSKEDISKPVYNDPQVHTQRQSEALHNEQTHCPEHRPWYKLQDYLLFLQKMLTRILMPPTMYMYTINTYTAGAYPDERWSCEIE